MAALPTENCVRGPKSTKPRRHEPARPLEIGTLSLRNSEDLAGCRGVLVNPGANFTSLAVQANAARLEQIGNSRNGFAIGAADAAHREDEFAQTGLVSDFLKGLFHN